MALGPFPLTNLSFPTTPPFPYWWSRDKLGLIKTNHPLRCLFSHTCFPTPLGSFPLTDSIYSLRSALVPPSFYKMLQFSLANRTGQTNPNKLCPPLKGKAQTLESDHLARCLVALALPNWMILPEKVTEPLWVSVCASKPQKSKAEGLKSSLENQDELVHVPQNKFLAHSRYSMPGWGH